MRSTSFRCISYTAAILGVLSPVARADDPVGRRYALLIGVNRYEHKDKLKQDDLKYAEADACELASALEASGFARGDVVLMTTAQPPAHSLSPRADNIRAELKALARKCAGDDVILVTFAGYERQFRDTNDYYLCPTDADPTDRATMVALSDVYETLAECKAGTKLVLIDSCRGQEREEGGQKQPPASVATFFATSAKEVGYEDPRLRGGVFTHFVIEGLGGAADANLDGTVTVAELERYVRPRTAEYVQTRYQARQRPELIGKAPTPPLVKVSR
jgi:uncharacterized caspase-like protein